MGPDQLEAAFRELAAHYKAEVTTIVGNDLLKENFPLIHTVGRASADAPRLLEMRWGKKGHRRITLVGKGVCFDTGGLDIKPASSMLLMKKDMGGAANVMGLALMIMDAKLKVDLRVIIPVVENSISSNAFRPGDIYKSRKGLTVQIDNTDAEGRLILADALAYADEDAPDLMIDLATLTGAARVALGPDVPAFFTDDRALAHEINESSIETRRSAVAPAPLYGLRPGYSLEVRRSHQRTRRRHGRLDHGGALSQTFRHQDEELGALRHFRLGALRAASRARRRRGADDPRALPLHPQQSLMDIRGGNP